MSQSAHVLVNRAIARAKAVPTDPTQWMPLLADLHGVFGACGTVFFTPEPGDPAKALGLGHGDLVDGIASYFSQWGQHDAWNCAVAGRDFFRRAGEVRFGHEFLPDAELKRTAFFNEWAQSYSAEQLVSLKVTGPGDPLIPVVHLTFFRRFADARYDDRDSARLRRLWPHLRHAVQASALLAPVQRADGPAERMLDAVLSPAWVVRDNGHIDFANQAACALMQDGVWVQVRHNRVCRLGELESADLKRCMHLGMYGAGTLDVTATSAVVNGHLQGRILRVMPIREAPVYASYWNKACALLTLDVPRTEQLALWRMHLMARFKLTPALCDVLAYVGMGMDIPDIAEARNTEVGTIKAQISELRARTGIKRYGELVRLAFGQ